MRLLILSLALALAAMAADIAGKWKAEYEMGGQTRTTTFDFKVDGNKLTGTATSARGGAAEIQDGTVNGDDVSFSVTRKFNDQEFKLNYKGKVSGNEMKLKVSAGEREFEMTARKES